MPKRSSKAKRTTAIIVHGVIETDDGVSRRRRRPEDPTDPILMAARAFRQATGEEPKSGKPEPPPIPKKNPAAVALGKLGGIKGGKARAAKLSARKRAEIARKAARARWRTRS